MKPTKSDIQKLIQQSRDIEVIQSGAFSNKQADLKKIQNALDKKSVVIVLH